MYQINANGVIVRAADGAHIPVSEGNADYRQYLLWLEEGNTPTILAETSLTEDIDAQRAAAYRLESDPIYFKWQRGEATQADWLASIQAIKERYPKPE